ncbi:glycosyltransferase involved in cell wall biosynthesis [Flavobacterium sp. 90]|uniref:glycosyltransferase family 2 protein n=1 Tax=unclassified Flavobacterium TaxID=196869 RepID=UPI000EB5A4CC|nr:MULTISPECIES: glycosyltransferase family 2 protein [unclassified Flavobacterium]RKR08679.1 glycosyltransferase involved in cell wall biosynthesis [Flavobacterium sp. 81]TCK52466.1 glycosyltransferase involved in cell wall biosynthesis [Flavobacterium sp. 90]
MVFFSVIIPLYNKENHIENTIKSVLDQTFIDYEIIVINDGSTDKSEALALEFNDDRIQIYNQKNQGVSTARNLGIEKSKGKLIAFLDADDYWFPNHLEELAQLYQDLPNCGIYCSRYKIKTAKNHFQTPVYSGIDKEFCGIVADSFYSNQPFRITWTSCLAIPKDILENFGGFTPNVTNGQDLELWTKIAIKYPVAITNTITAIYNNDIPNSLAKKNIDSMTLMDFEQFKIAEQQNPSLKKFLDLYRIEYGFRYYVFGNKDKSTFYLKDVDSKNIGLKIRFLLKLPPFCLRFLFRLKNSLKRNGFDFSIYD